MCPTHTHDKTVLSGPGVYYAQEVYVSQHRRH